MLRLPPRDFWTMSPRELAAAVRAFPQPARAPERAELDALMRRYPDNEGRRE